MCKSKEHYAELLARVIVNGHATRTMCNNPEAFRRPPGYIPSTVPSDNMRTFVILKPGAGFSERKGNKWSDTHDLVSDITGITLFFADEPAEPHWTTNACIALNDNTLNECSVSGGIGYVYMNLLDGHVGVPTNTQHKLSVYGYVKLRAIILTGRPCTPVNTAHYDAILCGEPATIPYRCPKKHRDVPGYGREMHIRSTRRDQYICINELAINKGYTWLPWSA
jgi:hypothetical protein